MQKMDGDSSGKGIEVEEERKICGTGQKHTGRQERKNKGCGIEE